MEIKLFIIVLISILVLDGIWIGFIAKNFYKTEMQNLAMFKNGGFNPRIIPIIILYLLMAFGVVYFVNPKSGIEVTNLLKGAFFGFLLYGVYDLTNYSLLKDFSLKLAVVDMIWGTFLLGIVSFIAGIII